MRPIARSSSFTITSACRTLPGGQGERDDGRGGAGQARQGERDGGERERMGREEPSSCRSYHPVPGAYRSCSGRLASAGAAERDSAVAGLTLLGARVLEPLRGLPARRRAARPASPRSRCWTRIEDHAALAPAPRPRPGRRRARGPARDRGGRASGPTRGRSEALAAVLAGPAPASAPPERGAGARPPAGRGARRGSRPARRAAPRRAGGRRPARGHPRRAAGPGPAPGSGHAPAAAEAARRVRRTPSWPPAPARPDGGPVRLDRLVERARRARPVRRRPSRRTAAALARRGRRRRSRRCMRALERPGPAGRGARARPRSARAPRSTRRSPPSTAGSPSTTCARRSRPAPAPSCPRSCGPPRRVGDASVVPALARAVAEETALLDACAEALAAIVAREKLRKTSAAVKAVRPEHRDRVLSSSGRRRRPSRPR